MRRPIQQAGEVNERLEALRRREVLMTAAATLVAAVGLLLFDWSVLEWLAIVWVEFAALVVLVSWHGYRSDAEWAGGKAAAGLSWLILLTGFLLLVASWGALVGGLLAPDGRGGNAGFEAISAALSNVLGGLWGWIAVAAAVASQVMHARPLPGAKRWDGLGAFCTRALALFGAVAVGAALLWLTGAPAWLAIVILPLKCWAEVVLLLPPRGLARTLPTPAFEEASRRHR